MLKLKKDYSCILKDKQTGRTLCTFTAQAVGDPSYSAGFEGGGVASASQALSIETEKAYKYKPLQHEVYVNGVKYLLTSFSPAVRRRLGAGWGNKPRTVYVLNLE